MTIYEFMNEAVILNVHLFSGKPKMKPLLPQKYSGPRSS